MTAKVAPVVLEKEGKPKPPSTEVRRKAKEIVGESGANSKQHFNRVVLVKERFESKRKSICGGLKRGTGNQLETLRVSKPL